MPPVDFFLHETSGRSVLWKEHVEPQSRYFDKNRIDHVLRYERLLEADLAIKTGRMEPDLALELLAADQPGR